MSIVILGSDFLLWLSLILLMVFIGFSLKKPINQKAIKQLMNNKAAYSALIILCCYLLIALLDSIHFQRTLGNNNVYSSKVESTLDLLFGKRSVAEEKTYSSPFSLHSYLKELKGDGKLYYPKLNGIDLKKINKQGKSVLIIKNIIRSAGLSLLLVCMLLFFFKRSYFVAFYLGAIVFLILSCIFLETDFHILGTDKIGQDVFYQTIKSIRTGLVIGLLTTLVMLPFAVVLGMMAGYFGGKLDDFIQYCYITISSIPSVLLIAASVLSMQVFISNHPQYFSTLLSRSDSRLVALCLILGLTGWTSLCRVIRAETLKLREIDYVQAALVLGSSHLKILFKHILPNVMHIILISVVLDFSFLVLAEAVLSYIGVGVSPLTISWGNMINSARLELAREPLVWWPMLAAFCFMFIFVVAVNVFADKLRDVLDPRKQLN